jgi:hypothetical protein
LTLAVTVSGPEQWNHAYEILTRYATVLGRECPNVVLSSYALGDEQYDDETMAKVRVSLREVGVPENIIEDAVNLMQNDGILFRERS